MAQIDELIATYLSAVETEGKAARTVDSYRDSLADFLRVGVVVGVAAFCPVATHSPRSRIHDHTRLA